MGRVDNTGNKEIAMNNNIRNKLKMAPPLLLVVAMLVVSLGNGTMSLAAPGGAGISLDHLFNFRCRHLMATVRIVIRRHP